MLLPLRLLPLLLPLLLRLLLPLLLRLLPMIGCLLPLLAARRLYRLWCAPGTITTPLILTIITSINQPHQHITQPLHISITKHRVSPFIPPLLPLLLLPLWLLLWRLLLSPPHTTFTITTSTSIYHGWW